MEVGGVTIEALEGGNATLEEALEEALVVVRGASRIVEIYYNQ